MEDIELTTEILGYDKWKIKEKSNYGPSNRLEIRAQTRTETERVKQALIADKRIQDYIVRTPTISDYFLSERTKADVKLKLDCYQITCVFKVRGVFNAILAEYERFKRSGVICPSAGNHGMAVAYASSRLGISSTIVLLNDANPDKVAMIKQYGGQIVEGGVSSDEVFATTMRLAKEKGFVYLPDDVPLAMAGAGTISLELMQEFPEVDTVIVPVGGGGLIAGIAPVIKALSEKCKVLGVQAESFPSAYEAFKADGVVTVPKKSTIADGLSVQTIAQPTFEVMREYVDDILLVSEKEIRDAVKSLLFKSHILAEPAAAASVAPLLFGKYRPKQDEKVGLLITGGNISYKLLHDILSEDFRL